ncbi:MAG: efflux RND transporter periplasmic adaptor subunit [Acidobacteria bacterium]|nr:efflux RND transporter periplasmic adaptor subunit [Acidobacteriota bacterium]
MLKYGAGALLLAAMALGGWWYVKSNEPPQVAFAKAERSRIESVVATNGKVEPLDWVTARAEREGLVGKVLVTRGQTVAAGQLLATLETREARAAIASAEARVAQIKVELDTLARGGRAPEFAEIDGSLRRAKLDRDQAARDAETVERLLAKRAATTMELQEAKDRVARAEAQMSALTARRGSLVDIGDRAGAQARLKDAEAAVRTAQERLTLANITAPRAGVVYQVDVRPGSFLTAGAPVASIGRVDRLRVVVYVDEPELGRVTVGLPVSITWDAQAGREWKGTVEKLPAQIVPFGTRQVGEVVCLIDNPDQLLPPGANINASIRAQVVDNALSIPKEALRRENGVTGGYVLEGSAVRWRPFKIGIASVTRIEIREGLTDGAWLALPTDVKLTDGLPVTATKP